MGCLWFKSDNIYCGNNSQFPGLLRGTHVVGSRARCLRKGIGRGIHLPYDRRYRGNFIPIDQRKIYCGNQQQRPAGYDIMGNPSLCIQKGVGVGKSIRARQGRLKINKCTFILLSIWLILCVAIFLGLFFGKPAFVLKHPSNTIHKQIDVGKFTGYYILFCVIAAVVVIASPKLQNLFK